MSVQITNHPIVGTVKWEVSELKSGRPIKLLDDFVRDNIITVLVPQLKGIKDNRGENLNNPFNGKLDFYRKGVPQLLAAFEETENLGFKNLLLSCAGSFNPRLKRKTSNNAPSTEPSEHSFGTAFDINNEFNPQGKMPPKDGQVGSVRKLVPIFEKHGFKWGGNFSTPDGMHFEIVKLMQNHDHSNHLITEIKLTDPFMNMISIGEIQKKLLDAGFDPKGIDNKYGRNTEKSVKDFQSAKGLTSNGIVDKITASALEVSFPFEM